jgi:hypothetical protein
MAMQSGSAVSRVRSAEPGVHGAHGGAEPPRDFPVAKPRRVQLEGLAQQGLEVRETLGEWRPSVADGGAPRPKGTCGPRALRSSVRPLELRLAGVDGASRSLPLTNAPGPLQSAHTSHPNPPPSNSYR